MGDGTGGAPRHEAALLLPTSRTQGMLSLPPHPGAGPSSAPRTYGPDSTWMEPTFSRSFSVMLGSSSVSSHFFPWKFSSS